MERNVVWHRGATMHMHVTEPALTDHLTLYRGWEARFGREELFHAVRRQIHREDAIEEGDKPMDWEPPPDHWDATIKHYWQACHVTVIEIIVAACGTPISHTIFPFAEGENDIICFMTDTYSDTSPALRQN